MRLHSLLFATLAVLGLHGTAAAQDWPSRPVTMIVPFTAGTTSDVVARGLAEHLKTALGQSIVIENRGGAGGNIGGAAAAKAQPDGYTFLFATTGPAATNKLMYKHMPFDPEKDFSPVVLIGKAPVIVVARKDAPFSDLKGMIDYAKKNPGKLTAGYPGNGTLGYITGELLQARAGIKLAAAQYRGSTPIITDLLGGHIDVGMDSMAAYVGNIEAGTIKALAMAGGKRWSRLPNVPTASESGLSGFEASVWYVILARTGTPQAIVDKLNAASNAYIKSAEAKALFDKIGVEASGGSPADAKTFIASEVEKWAPIIKAANISF